MKKTRTDVPCTKELQQHWINEKITLDKEKRNLIPVKRANVNLLKILRLIFVQLALPNCCSEIIARTGDSAHPYRFIAVVI